MDEKVDHDVLDDALRRCGASWDAAQTHGLLTARLAVAGALAGRDWLQQILEGTDESNALRYECEKMLDSLYQSTFRALSERLSEFTPLLPDDDRHQHGQYPSDDAVADTPFRDVHQNSTFSTGRTSIPSRNRLTAVTATSSPVSSPDSIRILSVPLRSPVSTARL